MVQGLGCVIYGFLMELKTIHQTDLHAWKRAVQNILNSPAPISPTAVQPYRATIPTGKTRPTTDLLEVNGETSTEIPPSRDDELEFTRQYGVNPLDYMLAGNGYIATGISVGLCGSITTFSTWQLDVFTAAFRIPANLPYHPSKEVFPPTQFQSLLVAFTLLIITWSISLSGFTFGRHLAVSWSHINPFKRKRVLRRSSICSLIQHFHGPSTSHDSAHFREDENGWRVDIRQVVFPHWNITMHQFDHMIYHATIALAIMTWAGVIVSASLTRTWRDYTLSACFAPVGVLLRFLLARFNRWQTPFPTEASSRITTPTLKFIWASRFRIWLAQLFNPFPWGTLLANVGGTALAGALFILGRAVFYVDDPFNSDGHIFCQFRTALIAGLCGCITTVSTFVAEARYQLPGYALRYVYVFLSIALAQIVLNLIVGLFEWIVQPGTRTGRLVCS
ncbi:hypothetical protein IWQ61_005833 [Dispira simplex]|nr:hypothetical protein IWQ61_005833 [Dispira simplex]